MTTARLQDFATSVTTRGQVTFGDVRRLQRDYLPDGIMTREEAEILIALAGRLVRADRAWTQWLVVALARYLESEKRSGACAPDATAAWLDNLLAGSPASTKLGRRIGRHVRRELAKLMRTEAECAPQPRADELRPVRAERCPPSVVRKVRPVIYSEIVVAQPSRRAAARPTRGTAPVLPVEIWQVGMMARHLRFQLERPCF